MSGKIDRSAEIYNMMLDQPEAINVRPGKTYRWFRRSLWRGTNPWASFNRPSGKWPFGTPPVRGHITTRSRSKYMPHNGKQEMARRVTQLDALIDRYTTSIMANVSIIANDASA